MGVRTWAFTDVRKYGLWMGKARWHALLDAAGFARVAEYWCAPALPVLRSRCFRVAGICGIRFRVVRFWGV